MKCALGSATIAAKQGICVGELCRDKLGRAGAVQLNPPLSATCVIRFLGQTSSSVFTVLLFGGGFGESAASSRCLKGHNVKP